MLARQRQDRETQRRIEAMNFKASKNEIQTMIEQRAPRFAIEAAIHSMNLIEQNRFKLERAELATRNPGGMSSQRGDGAGQ
jgi:hypothetical protein